MPNLLRHLMMQSRLMEGDPVDPGTSAPPVTPPAAPKTGNPLVDLPLDQIPDQWRDHARELRRENASLREKTKAIDEAAAQAKIDEAVKKAVEAQEAKTKGILDAEREASNRRIINAEVKAVAVSLGLQDVDAIKLIDTSTLKVDEATGEVAGVTELLATFKTAKPYLFKEPVASTSSTVTPPPKKKTETFDARTATKEEIAADAKARGLTLKAF
ncbi:MAG TPA: hypothetical protein VF783_14110 [Terriglobales bacterium]